MSEFIVVSFPDEESARQGMQALADLKPDHLVLHGAGIVIKDEKGTLSMQVVSDEGRQKGFASIAVGKDADSLGPVGLYLYCLLLSALAVLISAAFAMFPHWLWP